MARGRKTLTLDERLASVESQIAECTNKLDDLNKEKEMLQKQIREEKLNQLFSMLEARGITIEDAMERLK